MRVVHVSDFYLPRLGGIEEQVAEVAWRQQLSGHHVSVVTATELDVETGVAFGRPGRLGERYVRRVRRRSLLELTNARLLPATLDADVVHVHLGGVAPLGWLVLRARAREGLATVVTVHSLLDRLRPLLCAAGAWGEWRQAPFIWCGVSQRVAAQVRVLLGAEARVHVVPNAVDRQRWEPQEVHEPSPDRAVVVAALRHTRRKRAEVLPGVLARMAELVDEEAARRGVRAPSLAAVIAGDGHRWTAVRRAARRARVSGWVEMPGRLTHGQLRELYHRADVFVAPTVLESFGLAALEARAAGLPVVARSDSGSAEVLESGREGLLVSSNEGMARALARLALDVELRGGMAEHNARSPLAFDWPTTLALTEHAYAAALAAVGDRGLQRSKTQTVTRS